MHAFLVVSAWTSSGCSLAVENRVCRRMEECNGLFQISVEECAADYGDALGALSDANRKVCEGQISACLATDVCEDLLECVASQTQACAATSVDTGYTLLPSPPNTNATQTATSVSGSTLTNTPTGTTDLPVAEVVYDTSQCCDFDFSSSDCPQKDIGSLQFINRDADEVGEIDVNCDLVEGVSPIQWRVDGAISPVPFVVNSEVAALQTLGVEAVFVCKTGIESAFKVACRADIDVGTVTDEVAFDVVGTPM
jgi:hypothetical protein